MVVKLQLPYGEEVREISLPKKNLMGVIEPMDLPGVPDSVGEIRDAIKNPIASPSLAQLVAGKKKVIILVSDITRPSPSHLILPPLVDELNQAGVADDQITIVFGLGFHRKQSPQEQEQLVGEEIFNRIKSVDHDRHDCIYIGSTPQGTPVEIFRLVAEGDFVIATGNMEFHYGAGYTAGSKALFPGVASQRSIEINHRSIICPDTKIGKIQGNPMREDIEEAGNLGNIGFIVNVVLNSKQEIVKAVAGHRIKAHREGIKWVDKIYKHPISQPADIAIASCGGTPKDINLYQAQKGLENASYAVRQGGIIILLAHCPDGLGEPSFEQWIRKAKTMDEPIKWAQEKFVLGAHKAAVLCQSLKEKTGYLISGLTDQLVKECFLHPAPNVAVALEQGMKKIGEDGKILVLPNANVTVPVVE